MSKKRILLIGAGQLGSRYLQGIAKSNLDIDITVSDPSKKSIELSQERLLEVENNHKIQFVNSLPKKKFLF